MARHSRQQYLYQRPCLGGEPKRLLEMAKDGQIEIAVSYAILNEMSRILGGEKFAWPPERVAQVSNIIRKIAQHVEPTHKLDSTVLE